MKKISLLTGMCLLMMLSIHATEPLKDYSFVRGVCYPGGWMGDQQTIEKELGYAKRLQINSTRIWLNYNGYFKDPAGYIEKLKNYIQTAYKMGITTMPILWNGNMLDPAILKKEFREKGDTYVKAVVEAIKDEPGLLVWDIMNEPSCNDYHLEAPAEEKPKRLAEIDAFVRYYCSYVKKADPKNAITVGHTWAQDVKMAVDLVDVISFHDYLETSKRVENTYTEVGKLAEQYQKPLINSELACIGRANPLDMALEICNKHKAGWYIFELMIHGYWGDVHGLVYSDGTVRDPSVIAAVYGFYRNRDPKTSIKANPNKEGYAYTAIKMLEDALRQETKVFRNRKSSTDDILEAAEYCANLLEAGELVPMSDLPTAKIKTWREIPEKERDVEAIRTFAYELGLTLKKACKIY
jgi:hypothetical protein